MLELIAVLTPLGLAAFQAFARRNPHASQDETIAELKRLVDSDDEALSEYAGLADDIGAAKARLAARGVALPLPAGPADPTE